MVYHNNSNYTPTASWFSLSKHSLNQLHQHFDAFTENSGLQDPTYVQHIQNTWAEIHWQMLQLQLFLIPQTIEFAAFPRLIFFFFRRRKCFWTEEEKKEIWRDLNASYLVKNILFFFLTFMEKSPLYGSILTTYHKGLPMQKRKKLSQLLWRFWPWIQDELLCFMKKENVSL